MKATLTIELTIPDYEKLLALAKEWGKDCNWYQKYGGEDDIIADYIISDANKGYIVNKIDFSKEEKCQ